MSTTDELTERASASLNTLDCELVDLEAASRLLGHLSTTDLEISGSELLAVQMMVERAHDKIEASYNRARELFQAQEEAHSAALAEAQAAKAAPGSPADFKHAEALWSMLRAVVKVAAEECDAARGLISAGNTTS
jgi:hypothetical protein